MIVAGIGCRNGASADAVMNAITAALHRYDLPRDKLNAVASDASKSDEPSIAAAALQIGLPVVFVTLEDMQRVQAGALTKSPRVVALKGVPSIAETAALAAAGKSAQLLGPRINTEMVTCALAVGDGP